MKRRVYLFNFSIVVLVWIGMATAVEAGSRFDNGFQSVAWGMHKNQLPDLGISEKKLKKIYKNGPSSVLFMEGQGKLDMQFDGISLLSIFLHFNDQVFRGVDLVFKPEDREKIYNILSAEMKSAGMLSKEGHQWLSDNLTIVLTGRELMVTSRKEPHP